MHQQKAQQDTNTQILIDLAKDVKGLKTNIGQSNKNKSRPYSRPYNRGDFGRGRGKKENRDNSGKSQNKEYNNGKTSEENGGNLNA